MKKIKEILFVLSYSSLLPPIYRCSSLITTYDNGKYMRPRKRKKKEPGKKEERSIKDEYEKSEMDE